MIGSVLARLIHRRYVGSVVLLLLGAWCVPVDRYYSRRSSRGWV